MKNATYRISYNPRYPNPFRVSKCYKDTTSMEWHDICGFKIKEAAEDFMLSLANAENTPDLYYDEKGVLIEE